MSFFEFIKFEEESWRDFTNFGMGTDIESVFGDDGGVLDAETLVALRDMMKGDAGDLVQWAKPFVPLEVDEQTEAPSLPDMNAANRIGAFEILSFTFLGFIACI